MVDISNWKEKRSYKFFLQSDHEMNLPPYFIYPKLALYPKRMHPLVNKVYVLCCCKLCLTTSLHLRSRFQHKEKLAHYLALAAKKHLKGTFYNILFKITFFKCYIWKLELEFSASFNLWAQSFTLKEGSCQDRHKLSFFI